MSSTSELLTHLTSVLSRLTPAQTANVIGHLADFANLPATPHIVPCSGATDLVSNVSALLGSDETGATHLSNNLARFRDGELFTRLSGPVRGAKVFVFQSFAPCYEPDQPTAKPLASPNDAIIEFLITLDAVARAGPRLVTAVVPYFAYANQDCASVHRQALPAPLLARVIERAASHTVMVEPPSLQVTGFFEKGLDVLSMDDLFGPHLKGLLEAARAAGRDLVIVAARPASTARARRCARAAGIDLAIAVADNALHTDLIKTHGYVEAEAPVENLPVDADTGNLACDVHDGEASDGRTLFFRPFGRDALFEGAPLIPAAALNDAASYDAVSLVGDVDGAEVVIVDDALSRPEWIEKIAARCIAQGAAVAHAVAAHPTAPPAELRRLAAAMKAGTSPLTSAAVLPTVPLPGSISPIEVLAGPLEEALARVVTNLFNAAGVRDLE